MKKNPLHRHMRSLLVSVISVLTIGVVQAQSAGSSTTEVTPQTDSKSLERLETIKALKARCENPVSCTKADGDACAEAAAMILDKEPVGEYYDMPSSQRTKIAIRLLERGVDTSDLAAGRAFDLYDQIGFFSGGVGDAYRANELMQIMTKRNYVGATLRTARKGVSLLAFNTPDNEKRDHCVLAKRLLTSGKLDLDSKAVANEILEGTVCKNIEAQGLLPKN